VKRTILSGVALAGIAFFACSTSASASVTIDSAGKGFVGKGDVQTALGYNNVALQKAVDGKTLVFTAKVPTSQALSQAAEQTATQAGTQAGTQTAVQTVTQAGTQTVSQDLTCTYTNGNGTKVFHRDGVRDGDRTGTREGTREGARDGIRTGERDGVRSGTQYGTQTGSVSYGLDVEARKNSQYTGFILNGWTGTPAYASTGAPVWVDPPAFGDWTFGDYAFGAYQFGDYAFGAYQFGDYAYEPISDTEWGAWDALPGENPDDCLRSQNADKITQISNVISEGTTTDGAITEGIVMPGAISNGIVTDGAISEGLTALVGAITAGPVTTAGPTAVFVNGKAL
jgi:hypothetical protein